MKEVKYGVFLCFHPSGTNKIVRLHRLPCHHYKQHLNKGKAKGMYTAHKDSKYFTEIIEKASEWSLEWHAPIHVCKSCLKNWKLE